MSRSSRTSVRRSFASAIFIASAALVLLAPSAAAHTFLIASQPANGDELETSPPAIEMHFDGPVDVELFEIEVLDETGDAVELGSIEAMSEVSVRVGLPELEVGIYHVQWELVSPFDFHVARGVFVFGVGRDPGAIPGVSSGGGPGALDAVIRSLELMGFAVLVGALTIGWAARAGRGRLARRLRRMAAFGAVVAGIAGGLRLALAILPPLAAGAPWSSAVVTPYSAGYLVELAGVIALSALAGWPQRGTDAPWSTVRTVVTAGVAFAAALALSVPGHLAALGPAAAVVGALHVLAAAVWVGGLVALVVVVGGVRRRRRAPRPGASAIPDVEQPSSVEVARRFGLVAIVAGVGLAASGLASAGLLLPEPGLLPAEYAAILVAKTIILVGLGVLGLRNAVGVDRAVRRGLARIVAATEVAVRGFNIRRGIGGTAARLLGTRQSHGTIVFEAGTALIVLILGGVLASSAPAGPPADGWPTVAGASGWADDLIVRLEVRPVRPGSNFVTAEVHDTRRPAPGPIERVAIRIESAAGVTTYDADRTDSGWVTQVELAGTGPWTADVDVARAGLPESSTTLTWTGPAQLAADRPFVGLSLAAAVALGLLGAVGWGTIIALGRRPQPHGIRRISSHLAPAARVQ